MSLTTVKISEKGQIAIPRSIRKKMNFSRGDTLVLFQIDDKLLVEKSDKVESRIKDDFIDIKKASEKSLKKIWNNKKDEIWNIYLKD